MKLIILHYITLLHINAVVLALMPLLGGCQISHIHAGESPPPHTYGTKNLMIIKAGQLQAIYANSTKSCPDCHRYDLTVDLASVGKVACDACHGYPPAPRNVAVTFGIPNNWVNAKLENYSGGGGAHLVAAHLSKDLILTGTDADWTPCLPCHSDGENSHRRFLPMRTYREKVSVKVDLQYRFNTDSFIVYTTANFASGANRTGSCFNVSCHFKPSPMWST